MVKRLVLGLVFSLVMVSFAGAATHDYVISNAPGVTVRADINSVLQAIVTNNSGATEPATTYPNMWWYDTSTGLLKRRDNANTTWITVGLEAADTDGTLSANSDLKVATQKATKTYSDTKVIAPATNTADKIPQWNGANSKTLKDGLAVGTSANNLVQLDSNAKLPAIDGSALTNLSTTKLKVGTYAGNNGNGRAITGVGFQPDYLIIYYQGAAYSCQATDQDGGYAQWGNNYNTGAIDSFQADGFTISNSGNPNVNTTGRTYTYIAFKE